MSLNLKTFSIILGALMAFHPLKAQGPTRVLSKKLGSSPDQALKPKKARKTPIKKVENPNRSKPETSERTEISIKSLGELSGSYKLEKGPVDCPDGEFSGGKAHFILGASMRIEGINRGVVREEGPKAGCFLEKKALFNRRELKFMVKEKCQKTLRARATHSLNWYQKQGRFYIQLNYQRKERKGKTSPGHPFSFQCLYSKKAK